VKELRPPEKLERCGMAKYLTSLIVLFCIVVVHVSAETKKGAPQAELDAITARGRQLAEYDTASWNATDAVLATKPIRSRIGRYIAKKTESGWVVVFGKLNEQGDKFLIAYQATQETNPQTFTVAAFDPPQEDAGYFLNAEKAIETALKVFQRQQRPYNIAVLPAEGAQMYVYIYPGSTKTGTYVLGGDARYLVSADGTTIVENKQLHKAILEYSNNASPKAAVAGVHSHVLSEVPEDTDVLYVLTRKPAVPEYVSTMSRVIYVINVDGTISKAK
jgi:hypothetical protein